MSVFEGFFNFLFDDKKQLSQKAAVVVLVIIAIVAVDNLLGFTYYYNTEKKIQQIEKLNVIIKDSTIDNNTKETAFKLRSEIISRENFFTKIILFLKPTIIPKENKSSEIASQPLDKVESRPAEINIEKNNIWFHLSSGGFYYLFALIVIIVMPFTDVATSLIQKTATGLLTGIIVAAVGLLFYWICSLIPQISSKSWIWNYVVNITIQLSLFILSGIFNKLKRNKSRA